MRYYTILYDTIRYYTILYDTIRYYNVTQYNATQTIVPRPGARADFSKFVENL